ncbi:MAG: acyl--CoA ligase, partial [Clostridia bacterium]|nr:acyl--CoA ligase [Clostridia bacterium]
MKVSEINAMAEWIPQTMYRAVVGESIRFPDKEAIRFMRRSISFRRFISEADEVAARFVRLGVKKGDCVLLCMPNVPNIIVSVYALNKIGAVACPIHPKSSPAELSFYLADTKARFVLCYAPLLPFVKKATQEKDFDPTIITVSDQETLLFSSSAPSDFCVEEKKVYSWTEFLAVKKAEDVPESTDPEQLAVIFYSGGTTGTPKGIMLSSKNINALAYQTEHGSGLIPMSDYSMLAVIPMFHGFGFGVNVHLMLSRGGTSILIPKFSAVDL